MKEKNGAVMLLRAVRRVINETRQDRTCREFLQENDLPLVPFLGAPEATYGFFSLNPVGLEEKEFPTKAEEFIGAAASYFENEKRDKGPFAHHLPLTANRSKDYRIFGQVSCLAFLVPFPTKRSSEVTVPMAKACWPRALPLLTALKPKILCCSGSGIWKLLAGLAEEGDEPLLTSLPVELRRPLADLFKDDLAADKLVFRSSFVGDDSGYEPILVASPHLGRSALAKERRQKMSVAMEKARGLLYDRPSKGRIRVRRKG